MKCAAEILKQVRAVQGLCDEGKEISRKIKEAGIIRLFFHLGPKGCYVEVETTQYGYQRFTLEEWLSEE